MFALRAPLTSDHRKRICVDEAYLTWRSSKKTIWAILPIWGPGGNDCKC